MKELKFTQQSSYVGRNGEGKSQGLAVCRPLFTNDEIRIKPINSKGDLANCTIYIPVADIPALIEVLKSEAGIV